MSLFIAPITWELTLDELEAFAAVTVKPDGRGGPQDLYHDMEAKLTDAGSITLEDSELAKLHRYAVKYTDGGYQQAFRAVLAGALRAGWVPPVLDETLERPEHAGRRWDGKAGTAR